MALTSLPLSLALLADSGEGEIVVETSCIGENGVLSGSAEMGVGAGDGSAAIIDGMRTGGAPCIAAGALAVFVGAMTLVSTEDVYFGTALVAGDAEIAPVSRLTMLGSALLPEKNSAAERAGSRDGAGGKMSDWKESA